MELAKTDGKKWNWIKAVLKNADKEGVQSISDFEKARESHAIARKTKAKNNFTNYTQTGNYNFEEIEKRALEKRMEGIYATG